MITFISLLSNIVSGTISPLKGLKKIELSNGLKVFIKENHNLPLISLQVWVRVGSINETPETTGLAHFIEHMVFKGTKSYSAGEIAKIVEVEGGIINAGTSKEFTQFYVNTTTQGLRNALQILAEGVNEATFPPDELERERYVVIEEIKRSNDIPGQVLLNTFYETLFKETPYHWPVIGSSEVISKVTREQLEQYYRTYYVPNNMLLVIVGDVYMKEVLPIVKQAFGKYTKKPLPKVPELVEPKKSAIISEKKKKVYQIYLMGGFLGPTLQDEEQVIADISSHILGGTQSSRLYQKLREEKKIVWSIDATFITQKGSGIFSISALCPPEKVKEVQNEIEKEIENIIQKGVTDEELTRAKELIRSYRIYEQETYSGIATAIGYWATQNKLDMLKTYIPILMKINSKDIQNLLKKYYYKLNYAILVPE